MSQPRLHNGPHALEANAASAGLALGCAYSSSDEFEAELIQVRRKAGAYGAPHHRQALVALAVAAAGVLAVCLAVGLAVD
jgi:hypothetical protein